MKIVGLDSKKTSKKNDWKSVFNIRMFRYTFLKHLKWSIAYICFFIAFIVNVVYLALSFSSSKELVEEMKHYQLTFSFSFFYLFIAFISYKSLEVFRDEIDDGTLLIITSMPYSRIKIAFQKWLSLQIICLVFILSVTLLSPVVSLMVQGFSVSAWDAFKLVYENSLWLITRLIIVQLLTSSLVLFASLYFGQKTSLGIGVSFAIVLTLLNILLQFLYPNSFEMFDGVVIHIIYLIVGLGLLGALAFVFYKKDFT